MGLLGVYLVLSDTHGDNGQDLVAALVAFLL